MKGVIRLTTDALWAKKQEKGGSLRWLSLRQHAMDTRGMAGLLWAHWLSEGQRLWLASSLTSGSEELAGRLVRFLGQVHDIGKATPAFQILRSFGGSPDLDEELLEKLEFAGFAGISRLQLTNRRATPHALAGQVILSGFGVAEDLACLIGAHHGQPLNDPVDESHRLSYTHNYYQVADLADPVAQKWQAVQEHFFQQALADNGFATVSDLPQVGQPGQVILSGLMIMADWIASNEDFFPLLPLDCAGVDDQNKRLERAWAQWKLTDTWTATNPGQVTAVYDKRFAFAPRDIQRLVNETIAATSEPGLFILEAPMGSGKTEAALVGAEQLAFQTGRSGIFFGLPTQATSNGIFPRIKSWLDRLAEDGDDRLSIRLLHGKAALNPQFAGLARQVNLDDLDDPKAHILVNEWFSGRKTAALDDFVVGTVDQMLMVALKQKHLALRHLGFSKKVVIIDEVHAYDAYMSHYLYQALTWLSAYGVPVILLSATLPAAQRFKLVNAYLKGKEGYRAGQAPALPAPIDAYPLLTYTDGSAICQKSDFPQERDTTVEIKRLAEDDFYPLLDKLFARGGNIGIVVNTVRRAQDLARACIDRYGASAVSLLHSGFIATDRVKKEEQLLAMIGKDQLRPDRHIIIGTQVIEQSLDIDFDVLISDLAPMDLLIQRIGRLHRHCQNRGQPLVRPAGCERPVLYVLGTDEGLDFDSGSRAVYATALLARTQYFLPDLLYLPADISPLVQKVYGDAEINIGNGEKEKYDSYIKDMEASLKTQDLKAGTYCLKKPILRQSRRRRASLIGWTNQSLPNDNEVRAQAQVRDTTESIEIIAVVQRGTGYGLFSEREDISQQIGDRAVAKKMAQNTLRLPQVVCRPHLIQATIDELEAHNQKHLAAWQEAHWLKGELGLVFDEKGQAVLNGYRLTYDADLGLLYERM